MHTRAWGVQEVHLLSMASRIRTRRRHTPSRPPWTLLMARWWWCLAAFLGLTTTKTTGPKIAWAQTAAPTMIPTAFPSTATGTNILQFGCFASAAAFSPTSWVLVAGSVDQVSSGYASVPQCSCPHLLDLAGGSAGTIQQTLDTTPGHFYNVSYQISGNYNGLYQGTFTSEYKWGTSDTWRETYPKPPTGLSPTCYTA
jgi:hypothetical protein